jgi:hypothetical protein
MEQKLKIIKIHTLNKKQIYQDILSSSKKVQEIIKKTKINKSKFYKSRDPIKELEKIVYKKDFYPPSYPINKDPIKELEKIVSNESQKSEPAKKTCINNNYFKHEAKLILEKKTCKTNIVGKYKSKKIKDYKHNVLNYYNSSKQITIKIFTQKEIDKFINVLSYYSKYEQHVKIHKYIKKLNKYQNIQILYQLNLIKSKSKAPISILKNILYNYFCCNINIIR